MSEDAREPVNPLDRTGTLHGEVDGPPNAPGLGRRAVLQSLAGGIGMAVLASPVDAHVHQAAAPQAAKPAASGARAAAPALAFLDRHAFDTLSVLSEQIVPGARAAKVPEFLDRLLAVESPDTQKACLQSLGAFEGQARAAHGKPWKALTSGQATALLTKISSAPQNEGARRAFEFVKGAVAETYYATPAGMKELGWNGGVLFASPAACG